MRVAYYTIFVSPPTFFNNNDGGNAPRNMNTMPISCFPTKMSSLRIYTGMMNACSAAQVKESVEYRGATARLVGCWSTAKDQQLRGPLVIQQGEFIPVLLYGEHFYVGTSAQLGFKRSSKLNVENSRLSNSSRNSSVV